MMSFLMGDPKLLVVQFLLVGAALTAGLLLMAHAFGCLDVLAIFRDDRDKKALSAKKLYMFGAFCLHSVCTLYAVMSGTEAGAVLLVYAGAWISPVIAGQISGAMIGRAQARYQPYPGQAYTPNPERVTRGTISEG